jgi:hypothetical protein
MIYAKEHIINMKEREREREGGIIIIVIATTG